MAGAIGAAGRPVDRFSESFKTNHINYKTRSSDTILYIVIKILPSKSRVVARVRT